MTPTSPPHPQYQLALLGFGNVGQALVELLIEKQNYLIDNQGIDYKVVGVATGSHGIAINPQGLSLEALLEQIRSGKSLNQITQISISSSEEFLQQCPADIVFESIPVNYQDGQPAVDYLEVAIEKGMHAITANKGAVVYGYHKLNQLAKNTGVSFLFESSVMDGAPVFSIARSGLPGAVVHSFSGILNSTSNLILTRMESGETQDEAIAYAQSIGIAETDPSGDIDGWDAAVKIAALVTVLLDTPYTPEQVKRTGIRSLTPDLIEDAREKGKRWKLICSAHRDQNIPNGIAASVQPQQVGPDSIFYQVTGTSSMLQIETDVLGRLSLLEEDPSPRTTAYGLLADFLNAVQS